MSQSTLESLFTQSIKIILKMAATNTANISASRTRQIQEHELQH
jgi:hypothetical protein